jgi:hypothetical protein
MRDKVAVGYEGEATDTGWILADASEEEPMNSQASHEPQDAHALQDLQTPQTLAQSQVSERSEEALEREEVKTGLLREVQQLHFYIDRALASLLLLGAILLQWRLLPLSIKPAVMTAGVGVCTSVVAARKLGVLDNDGVLILLLDLIFLVPYNAMMFALFYPTWPVRMLIYQAIQWVLIPLITFGKERVPPWQADLLSFLRILPEAFNLILPSDPKLKPFKNIDDASQEDVAKALRNAPFILWLSKFSAAHIPKGFLNSLGFRLGFLVFACPTLGWWLVGPCYIPLLPVRPPSAAAQKEDVNNKERETAADVVSMMPAVSFYMPQCRFLKVVRTEFGETVGQQKCLNE